jgi:hypothetical protein
MIRARVERRGKEYHLGRFQTKKEVDAAKEAATRVLDRIDADQPAPVKPRPPTIPSLKVITQLVEMGVYDRNDEGILALIKKLMKRHDMVSDGVQHATPPIQTLSMDELVLISGGSSVPGI